MRPGTHLLSQNSESWGRKISLNWKPGRTTYMVSSRPVQTALWGYLKKRAGDRWINCYLRFDSSGGPGRGLVPSTQRGQLTTARNTRYIRYMRSNVLFWPYQTPTYVHIHTDTHINKKSCLIKPKVRIKKQNKISKKHPFPWISRCKVTVSFWCWPNLPMTAGP